MVTYYREPGGWMKEEIKIAIFGLSLNVLDSIKQKIRSMYDDTMEVTWANIADPQLDILLVNDMFFGSPTIQNLVGAQQVPYLRLVNKSELSGQIDGDKMYLPFTVSDQTRQWFKDRYLHVPLSNAAEKTVSQASRNLDIGKIISEFLTERNGNLQVFDGSGNIGLMNTRTEQVWIDAERKLPGIDAGVNFTYATMQMAQTVKGIQGVDLRSWLWNVLWHSSEIVKDVDYKAYYQLKSWPQPNNKLDRQAIFRIAACFEKGASVAQVEQKSKVPADVIRRFVKIAVLMQMLVETEEKQARLITEEKPAEGLLKGFFGKLRKKLGL